MKRIKYLDNIKGFAILMVMLGHTNIISTYPKLVEFVQSFHVPIFFIVTGIIFGMKELNGGIFEFNVLKKLKLYMLPYCVFSILYIVIVNGMTYLGNTDSGIIAFKSSIIRFLSLDGVFATWFLPAIFIAEMIFIAIHNDIKNYLVLISVVLGIIPLLLKTDILFINVLLRAFSGVLYIFVGYSIASHKKTILDKKICYAFMLIFYLLMLNINGLQDLANMKFGNYPVLYYFESIFGSLIFIKLFETKFDKKLPLLTFFGKNTIVILVTHRIIYEVLWMMESKFLSFDAYIEPFIMFAFTVILEYGVIYASNHYLYFLFGKKKQIREN